jgi:hypothetical protein
MGWARSAVEWQCPSGCTAAAAAVPECLEVEQGQLDGCSSTHCAAGCAAATDAAALKCNLHGARIVLLWTAATTSAALNDVDSSY